MNREDLIREGIYQADARLVKDIASCRKSRKRRGEKIISRKFLIFLYERVGDVSLLQICGIPVYTKIGGHRFLFSKCIWRPSDELL